jgi:hypothetical protein
MARVDHDGTRKDHHDDPQCPEKKNLKLAAGGIAIRGAGSIGRGVTAVPLSFWSRIGCLNYSAIAFCPASVILSR